MRMHRPFTPIVVALILLGVAAPSFRPAAAQVADETYTDPEYDWEMSWDGDRWTNVDDPAYALVLWNEGGSYVFFQNRAVRGSARDCVDGLANDVKAEEGVDDVQLLPEAGSERASARSEDQAVATYRLRYTNVRDGDGDRTGDQWRDGRPSARRLPGVR